jgi:hypothetical protein
MFARDKCSIVLTMAKKESLVKLTSGHLRQVRRDAGKSSFFSLG